MDDGIVVISAHGTAPHKRRDAVSRGLSVLDVTCPFVTKVHRSARSLVDAGFQVVLVGDSGHTEVEAVVAAIREWGGKVCVVSSAEDLDGIDLCARVGVLSQTTQFSSNYAAVVAAVARRASELRAVNTVCGATEELQSAAADMAKSVDVAIVLGGMNSANTRRLREICAAEGIPAYHVERADEACEDWLEGKHTIGITAGASTPDWIIEDTARRLNGGELPGDWALAHPEDR